MPRDASGNYTLAPGNPVVAGTLITDSWCNPTMSDIASALTDSLSRSGSGGMLVPMKFADGSRGSPGITWTNEPTSGWYRSALNTFTYAINNADVFTIGATGITLAPGKTAVGIAQYISVQDAQPSGMQNGQQWFVSNGGQLYMRYQNPDTTFCFVLINGAATGNYVPAASVGVANGVASLDSGGHVPTAQLPYPAGVGTEWLGQSTPTYISATQFSVAGNQTGTFDTNRRIRATVTAGTIYGTITAQAFTTLTTVTVKWDGAGALDSGLSAVALGILDPAANSVPMSNALVQSIINQIFATPASDLENILINGDMRVSQLNASAAVAVAAGTSPYTVDQWQIGCGTTQALSVQRVATGSGGGGQYALSFSVTTAKASQAAGDTTLTVSNNEGLNTQKLLWGSANARTVTLQFRFITSIANAVLAIAFVNGASNRSYVTTITTGAANTWAPYSVTVPGDITGTWPIDNTCALRVYFGWGIGSTFQASTPNTWTAGQFLTVAGATNFMASTANTWQLADADLKAGSLVLPITRRSYEAELLLCQRYLPCFVNSSGGTSLIRSSGVGTSATSAYLIVYFMAETRVVPTAMVISAPGNFFFNNGAAALTPTALAYTAGNSSQWLAFIAPTVASGITLGQAGFLQFNGVGAYMYFTGAQM